MKVALCRLRNRVSYRQPLEQIMDVYFAMLRHYTEYHPEIEWLYYGIEWHPNKPKYIAENVRDADVVAIVSEAEFTYFVPGLLHSLDVARSNERVRALAPYIANKRVIVLRDERRDDRELFTQYTWPDTPFDYREIDGGKVFTPGIHALKYWFFRDLPNNDNAEQYWTNGGKQYDFAYWGTDKSKAVGGGPSGDTRHMTLKAIDRTESIVGLWYGLMHGVREKRKFSPLRAIASELQRARLTLCFQWIDARVMTARYFEALGCGIVPLVWQSHDPDNLLGIQEWQRVWSTSDAIDRIRWFTSLPAEQQYERFLSVDRELRPRIASTDGYMDIFHARFSELLSVAA